MAKYLIEGRSVVNAARVLRLSIVYKLIAELRANPRNPRKHSEKQVHQIARSVCSFGFLVPVLIDGQLNIIAGHGRVEAARLLGMTEVPTICVTDLTEAQIRAFMIADNRLTENSEWDERLLAEQLKELSELKLDFALEDTGFETPEIDLLIEGLSPAKKGKDPADLLPSRDAVQVSASGDLWLLGAHRMLCGDAQELDNFGRLTQRSVASMIFTDPPYNVPIDGHASGKGVIKHSDFVMASGEMTRDEFTNFLVTVLTLSARHVQDGALAFVFMDWRHMYEVVMAGEKAFSELKNLCIWTKDRAGMGSLYRSQHELVFVFKKGSAAHLNNIQLGSFGRYRSNVWAYPSAVSFGRSRDEENVLASHPTPKPVALVADAILDCSKRKDIVLDPFLGSGTTMIAAEKYGRVCYGIEIDPTYVDVTVRRWQMFTGRTAIHEESGRSFTELEEAAKDADSR